MIAAAVAYLMPVQGAFLQKAIAVTGILGALQIKQRDVGSAAAGLAFIPTGTVPC